MSDITRQRISERLDVLGKSATSVSKDIDASPGYLRDFLKGRAQSLTTENIAKIAKVLETSTQWLLGESDVSARPTQRRELPVMGTAAGSILGAMQWTGEVIESFPSPPGLSGVRDAYALYVTGDSMRPLYQPRDPIFVNPHHPVRQGDIIVIQEERDGEVYAWVKEFVSKSETEIICQQYNPASTIKFKRKFIIAVHRVLPLTEILNL